MFEAPKDRMQLLAVDLSTEEVTRRLRELSLEFQAEDVREASAEMLRESIRSFTRFMNGLGKTPVCEACNMPRSREANYCPRCGHRRNG